MSWKSLLATGLLLFALCAPLPLSADEEEEGAQPELVTRLVPVAFLTAGRTEQFRVQPPGGVLEYQGDEERPLFGSEGEEPFLPYGTVDELIELIKGAVEPRFWEEVEGSDIRSSGEYALVIRAERRVQDAVAGFLAGLERDIARSVVIDVHAVHLGRNQVRELRRRDFDDESVGPIVDGPDAGPCVTVTAHAGLRVAAFGGTQRAWLASHSVEVAQESHIPDPLTEVANLGLAFDVVAVPVSGTDRVIVGLRGSLSRHAQTRQVNTGAMGSLEAAVHDVTIVHAAVTTRDGAWMLVDGAGKDGGEAMWYFLVRATLVDAPDIEPSEREFTLPALHEQGDGPMSIRYFPIRDLMVAPAWVIGSVESYLTPSHYTPPEPNELPEPAPLFPPDSLVAFVRELGPGEIWEDPASIEVRNGIVIARNTPHVLAGIDGLLQTLRAGLQTVTVTAQLIETSSETARQIGVGRDGLRRLKEALDDGRAHRVEVAHVTSLGGARNTVTSGRHVPYVCDYHVRIAQGSGGLEPEVAHFLEGVELDVQPIQAIDGRTVNLDLRFVRTRQAAPMRKVTVFRGATLELPELEVLRMRTNVAVPMNVPTIVGVWGEGDRRRMLLVQPEVR